MTERIEDRRNDVAETGGVCISDLGRTNFEETFYLIEYFQLQRVLAQIYDVL